MNENDINIKIGDMIQSDTGACGIVVRLPDNENYQYHYIMNWNKGEPKEWGTDPQTMKHLIGFGKWKVIPL
jgi:hypothetical protein